MRHAWIIALMGMGGLFLMTIFMVPPLQQVADNNTGFTPLEKSLIEEFSLTSVRVSVLTPGKEGPSILSIIYTIRKGEVRTEAYEAEKEMQEIVEFSLSHLPEKAPKRDDIREIKVHRSQIISDNAPHILTKIEFINDRQTESDYPYDFNE